MKILAINSSFRAERGYADFLTQLLFEGARQAGADCETVYLSKLKINHCLACNRCQETAHQIPSGDQACPDFDVTCVFADKDDAHLVFDKMRQADLIIYATPVYVFNISSLLKNFLERFYGLSNCQFLRATKTGLLFHHIDPDVMSTPFVPLIVCDNLEDETPATARQFFKSFALFMEAEQRGVLVRNGGSITGFGDEVDMDRFPALGTIYSVYKEAGREIVNEGRISRATQRKANQEVIPVPFFHLLKRIRLVTVKQKFAEKAHEMKEKGGKQE
jgi:NAD(P)H-dependent FMN reductase